MRGKTTSSGLSASYLESNKIILVFSSAVESFDGTKIVVQKSLSGQVEGYATNRNYDGSGWVLFKDRMWVLGGTNRLSGTSYNSVHSFGPPQ